MTTPSFIKAWLPPSRLHRAIVSLPIELCERDRPLQERIVFFETCSPRPARQLEELLAHAWGLDTAEWCERGFIYNVCSSYELLHEWGFGEGCDRNLRLLETGSGGELFAVGEQRIHYARTADVDLFVTPRVAAHLQELLATVEHLYEVEPARREAAAAAAAQGALL